MDQRYFVEGFFSITDHFPSKTNQFLSREAAVSCAERYAIEFDLGAVYVSVWTCSFASFPDGETTFLNRSGASGQKESWVI